MFFVPQWLDMPVSLIFLTSFGLVAVGLAFIVLMPGMGNLVASLWLTVMGERAAAKARGVAPGSELEGH